MARSIGDLELELDVLAGPDRWNAPAWRLELPPARADDARPSSGSRPGSTTRTARSTPRRGRVLDETVACDRSRPVDASTRRRGPASRSRRSTPCSSACCSRRSPAEHTPDKIEHMAANTDDTPAGFCQAGDGDAPPRLARRQRAPAADPRAVAAVLRALRRDPDAGPAARRDPPRPLAAAVRSARSRSTASTRPYLDLFRLDRPGRRWDAAGDGGAGRDWATTGCRSACRSSGPTSTTGPRCRPDD